MIDGVTLTPLRQIGDDRGKVMHMLRRDSPVFVDFGEIYFSTVHPGIVKGWHIHKRMVLNYAVPHGEVRVVLYDQRPESPTRGQVQEAVLSPEHYALLTIPPGVWSGFQGLGSETAILANCASLPHDPDEIDRLDPTDPSIPYDWDKGGQ